MYGLLQLQPIFKTLDEYGVDCVVVGGFAIFLWAERYVGRDSRYAALEPFTSQDLDLIADRDEAIIIGRALSAKPKLNPGTEPGPNAATLLVRSPSGPGRLRIDVLTSVFGADSPAAFASAQVFEFPGGFRAKALDPFLCLQSKVLNLFVLDDPRRNDERHTRVAMLNLENRIKELLASDLPGSDRDVLNITERTFRLALGNEGQQIQRRFGIAIEDAIPTGLFVAQGEKLARFFERRLPQLQAKLQSKRWAGDQVQQGTIPSRYIPRQSPPDLPQRNPGD
jgi:hypothetical protein